jgi:DNA-binding transcriptional regulator YhcF (GntR family)
VPSVTSRSSEQIEALTHGEGRAIRKVRADLINRVAALVDVDRRSDLRRRLADALEQALRQEDGSRPLLLPSTRTLAGELGIHRKTAHAALQILVDRSVLDVASDGRFVMLSRRDDIRPDASPERLVREAASALHEQMSESQFADLARRAYRQATLGGSTIVFVEPSEWVPGMTPDDLMELLDYPVAVTRPDQLVPGPGVVFVATSTDAAAVRTRLNGRADVFAVGLTFDTDIRLATTNVDEGGCLAVAADNDAVLMAVLRRVTNMRPDLDVTPYVGRVGKLAPNTSLLLAPATIESPELGVPVARYRCSISAAELRFLQARLQPEEPDARRPAERPLAGEPHESRAAPSDG